LKETTKCSKNAKGKMEWSLPEKLKAKCEASPAQSQAPATTPPPVISQPSTGTRCPARTLVNKCKINCGKVTCSGGLGSDIETGNNNGVSTTTWKVPEGPDGASCVLSCPDEGNLKETTKCSKNAEGKMEWSLPEKLKAKCEASPAASSALSPTKSPDLSQPSTERTCPSTSLIKKCKITCETAKCTGNVSGNNGLESGFENLASTTTWNLGKGDEGATCTIDCPKENLKETSKCSLNAATKKMEWTMPEKLKAKCGG